MDIFEEYAQLFKNLSQVDRIEWMTTEEAVAIHDYIIESSGHGYPGIRKNNCLHNIFFRSPDLDQENDSGDDSFYDVAAPICGKSQRNIHSMMGTKERL